MNNIFFRTLIYWIIICIIYTPISFILDKYIRHRTFSISNWFINDLIWLAVTLVWAFLTNAIDYSKSSKEIYLKTAEEAQKLYDEIKGALTKMNYKSSLKSSNSVIFKISILPIVWEEKLTISLNDTCVSVEGPKSYFNDFIGKLIEELRPKYGS